MTKDETSTTMEELGLRTVQARVYLALLKSGISSARAVARIARVAPQDIYRLLNELADEGLVEKIIDKPTKYLALPLDEGLEILLNRRKAKMAELEKAVTQISETSDLVQTQFEEAEGAFVIIPEREAVEKMIDKIFLTAQTSVDVLNDFKEVVITNERHLECKNRAINNQVRIREIICDETNDGALPESMMRLLYNSNVHLRKLQGPAPARLIIKDKTEVFFATMTKKTTIASAFMWSNNQTLLGIVNNWYDFLWNRAKEAVPQESLVLAKSNTHKAGINS